MQKDSPRSINHSFAALMICYGIALFWQIDLMNGELGQILVEGQNILYERSPFFNNSNYLNPLEEQANFQWLSALIFHCIEHNLGFSALHLFSIAIKLFSLYLILRLSIIRKNPILVLLVGLAAMPIICYGEIVSPSIFGGLSLAMMLTVWNNFYLGNKNPKQLLFLLPIIVFWANTHDSFLLGILLIISMTIDLIIQRNDTNNDSKISAVIIPILCLAGIFMTPNTHKVIPFLSDYIITQRTFVLDSERDLLSACWYQKNYYHFYGIVFLVWHTMSIFIARKKGTESPFIFSFSLNMLFIIACFLKADLLPIACLWFLISVSSNYNTQNLSKSEWLTSYKSPILGGWILLFTYLSIFFYYSAPLKRGLGLNIQSSTPADFFTKNHIQGPIFNNMGIASYLNYYVSPHQKLFVSNQFENHPSDFFTKQYFSAINDEASWHILKNHYQFNAIFFNLKNEPIQHLNFLSRRLEDGEWALVYQEMEKTVILIRKIEAHQNVINQYNIDTTIKK